MKRIKKELTLDDVGKEVVLSDYNNFYYSEMRAKVIMGVKHPRGHLFLFETNDPKTQSKQIKALKSFMQFCKMMDRKDMR